MLLHVLCTLALLSGLAAGPAEEEDAEDPTSQPAASQPVGPAIEGIVTDSMGGGIARAKVRLETADAAHTLIAETTTSGPGEIRLPLKSAVTEKIAARVTITHDGYATFTQDVELVPEEDLPYIDATLTGTARIRGQVRRGDDNAPVPGAAIHGVTGSRELDTKTDRNGRFVLEGVDRGEALVSARAPGWATEKQRVHVDKETVEIFLELKPQRPVRIVATLDDGKPAPELLIEIMMQPSQQWLQATTDDKGEANLEGVPVTTEALVLRYNGPGYVQMSTFAKPLALPKPRSTGTAPSDIAAVDVPLKIQRSATVQGTVVDAAGQPVLGVRVIAGREPYGYVPMTWSSQDGTYELIGLPPGPNVLSFQHDGHVTLIKECTIQAGEPFALNATLSDGKPARGRIVDGAGKPVPGACITVERWNGHATMGMRTFSGDDGVFEFPHAPDGEMEISVGKGGFAELTTKLTAGQAARDLALAANESDEEQPGRQQAARLKIGDAVPELTLTATDGKTYKLSELKGKFVFVDCWASWCGPCMAEVPNLKALREATKDRKDFVMIGINLDKDRAAFDKAIAKDGVDWLQVTGAESGAEKAFGTLDGFAIPYMGLIDPDGKLAAQDLRGPGLVETVKKRIDKK